MIDLSNHNTGNVNWHRVYTSGQRRAYLKLTEGANFLDARHSGFRIGAHAAGIRTGEYHFARPSSNTPQEEAAWFLQHLPQPLTKAKDLRPCLDLEDPRIRASAKIGVWAEEWIRIVHRESGHVVIVYGNAPYLEACELPHAWGPVPFPPLWIAGYGRNDGREYPYRVPAPWSHAAAHQYASTFQCAGITGQVDISHVFHPEELDIAQTR